LDEGGDILALHIPGECIDADARKQCQRNLRPDARYPDQAAKQTSLILSAEPVEHVGILTYHQVCEEAHLLADGRQMEEGRHRRLELVAEAPGLHQQLRRSLRENAPPYRSDHREDGGAASRIALRSDWIASSCSRRECA